jgi:glyoxylase-like metal-dependent hydrolase (beta-lactamase superfamily II)
MTEHTAFRIINIGALSVNKFWGEAERCHETTATCTLLEHDGQRILVDPSPHPPELERFLWDRAGLEPPDIDLLFVTHFHGDHLWGAELFSDRPWLMAQAGLDEWRAKEVEQPELAALFSPAEDNLPEGVALYPCPGHTWSHCGLRVETRWGTLIVAGDSVMTPEHFEAEEGHSNAVDFALSTKTIQAIKADADLVIPGHANLILNQRGG